MTGEFLMTAQRSEWLILNGEPLPLHRAPPVPEPHERIRRIPPEEWFASTESREYETTGCWRRYVGTWEVHDGRLYLQELRGALQLLKGDPLQADWFSGVLRVSQGACIESVDTYFLPIHEREIRIEVRNGVVVETRILEGFKELEAARELLLEDQPNLDLNLGQMAAVHEAAGDNADAETCYRLAVEVGRKLRRPENRLLARHLRLLACLCRKRMRLPEAMELFSEALEMRRKLDGPDHPETKKILASLAALRPEA